MIKSLFKHLTIICAPTEVFNDLDLHSGYILVDKTLGILPLTPMVGIARLIRHYSGLDSHGGYSQVYKTGDTYVVYTVVFDSVVNPF